MKKIYLNIFLVMTILISSGIVGKKIYQQAIDKETYNEIKSYKDQISLENDKVIEKELLKLNDEYKFWITIPNTSIDYPVVQGKDNQFYLKNSFYKEENLSGSIFLNNENDIESDRNLLIYGHHMKNGSMFADIVKFKDEKYFNEGKIKIIKNNKEFIYEVFSVFVEDGDKSEIQYKFDFNEEYDDYIEYLRKKSILKKNNDKNYSKIITLYTCSYEFESARTIVTAGLVED